MRRQLAPTLAGGLIIALVALVVLVGLVWTPTNSVAGPDKGVDIRYIYVTGEGATAKAWFDGAPSPGVSVQDALDKFGDEGFRVARMTDNLRSTEDNVAFTVLLERVR